MADQETLPKRLAGLTKFFNAVIHGHRDLKSPADGNRFLEALCTQEDACKSVESLIAAPKGLSSIAKTFRFSRENAFLNGPSTRILLYLSHPSLKQLYNGQFLHRVLEQLVQPPTFWNALVEAHRNRVLADRSNHAFAWLLLELLCSRSDNVPDVRSIAEQITSDESLTTSVLPEVRQLGYKIKCVLGSTSFDPTEDGPGGRHDNDFADFRRIKILPTPNEFAFTERPFYRRADAIDSVELEQRELLHLDNQFRLLREDLLGELRQDFQIATGAKKGRRKTVLTNLTFAGIDCGQFRRRKPCCLIFCCKDDIPQLRGLKTAATRKKYVSDNRNFIKHQSLGCLCSQGKIVAFATIDRDEDKLAKRPSEIVLRVTDEASIKNVLHACKSLPALQLIQIDTAVFAYEPILNCLQNMTGVPLREQLFNFMPGANEALSDIRPLNTLTEIIQNKAHDLKSVIGTAESIELDAAQAESLLAGLSKKVSLIQGPPGTGKSFIGALIAKIFHDQTTVKILVQTYTNHALDQYLEDLLDIGIPTESIVRLGPKSTTKTKPLSLFEQVNTYKRDGKTFNMIRDQEVLSEGYHDTIANKVAQFRNLRVTNEVLLDYLEFSEDSDFFDAFTVPDSEDDMQLVGHEGKNISPGYLISRWINGHDAGVFHDIAVSNYPEVWRIASGERLAYKDRWTKEIIAEKVSEISHVVQKYNQCQDTIIQLRRKKTLHILQQKRIIGCTTTAAAKNTQDLQKAAPDIIIVEEAGEILESHILTAMSVNIKQLVLIGDHKQLRPKVSNYSLTVEKGDGYNLNQSLFERLVLGGVPHTTLNRQHRMRPEISQFVRSLNYPELEDAPKTKNRPRLRGLQDNVIFVSHNHPELNADPIAEHRDEGAKASKENEHEVGMVLKCVRYLGQQGYGTDSVVILTPYLGQLYRLMKAIAKTNDPVLNDLDSFELMRAGLLSPAGANISKPKIKMSTIDNYQGEESKIVITSLTRSNDNGDIGFMAAAQRVNVLLSRARDSLIIIGNAETFMKSRKGKEVWVPLMDQLKRRGHVYSGFPVECEQHPEKKALLSTEEAFDLMCPDGGCSEPCEKQLSCGLHTCPHRCHQLQDHSKMECKAIVTSTCPQKHESSRECRDVAGTACQRCLADARARLKKRQRDFKLDQERQAKQLAYAAKLAELDDEIEYQRRVLKDQADERNRLTALGQKKHDLASLKEKARDSQKAASASGATCPQTQSNQKSTQSTVSNSQNPSASHYSGIGKTAASDASAEKKDNMAGRQESEAKKEWLYQKEYENASNEALDALMSTIGLESVKMRFLSIKTKVDTQVRQNVPLNAERYGAALLGNPGTGKTTVARHYAKFLVDVGALPGDHFFETSGSSLANDGVSACKGHIDKILGKGGGVFFIDEAYQLVSGNSPGGKAVLDFLLAEIENLTGKIVFVLAGYHKQMEAFFAHNPGIPSRIPIQMEFEDYSDQELQKIFCYHVSTKYKGSMQIEGGMAGLYVRIVARRIGRGRGRDGFGNAREVQNRFSQIADRQAKRLRIERRAGLKPDDHLLTKEDLIGPEPSAALSNNAEWIELQGLIGLDSVKDSVRVLLDGIQYNYHRELEEKPLVQYSLNRCFVGSPGTGKTSVAKLYGRILADIGLLSNGEVVLKNPADFVGNVLGASESNTKGILASTLGKVLIIDEAYMLAGGSTPDRFKIAVIDTIVAEVQSTPGEDRCVLLLGYKDQMEEMFRDVNPGLARRFPLDSAFVFEDFNDVEIGQILDLKLKTIGYNVTDQARNVALEVIQRARCKLNFGNAGEVDIILDRAKALHQKHLKSNKVQQRDTFEAVDFDPDFDRGQRAATNLPRLFQDVIGMEALIKQLQDYQNTAANLKALGMDPREQIPFNFLFKGPPGTGKTTTARKMGKVFYDMGFLAQANVIDCSATDLIGQYVGHTGPKVQKQLEKALGKVLFIDESYRLAEGRFATEALDEIVDCLTKPKFAQKLVTILAGYDKDIDRLMSKNPGLNSRFPDSVFFAHFSPVTSLKLLTKSLEKKAKSAPLDMNILANPSSSFKQNILDLFSKLCSLESWGNARDVESLAKGIFGNLISTATQPITSLILTENLIIQAMKTMLKDRSRRNEVVGKPRFSCPEHSLPLRQAHRENQSDAPLPVLSTNPSVKDTETQKAPPPPAPGDKKPKPNSEDVGKVIAADELDPLDSILEVKRDRGVSDAVWEQLDRDKHAAIAREQKYRRLEEEKREEDQRITKLVEAEQAAKDEKEKRQREQARFQAELERRRKEVIVAAMEKQRKKEKAAQKKLRELGPCPAGFWWVKQVGGYRCAGGSHWLSDAHLNLS